MDDDNVSIELPAAHFTLFNSTREGLVEVIVVNDALLGFRHAAVFAWSLRVRLEARELAAQGMPTPDESEILRGIDEEIESTVLSAATDLGSTNSLFLARSTWNGLRELYFQVHDPEASDYARCSRWRRALRLTGPLFSDHRKPATTAPEEPERATDRSRRLERCSGKGANPASEWRRSAARSRSAS